MAEEKTITGYPSIDKPWLKYYGKASDTSELPSPDCSLDAFLPESHIPDEYIFVEDFPLTRAGKIDYRALEDMTEKNSQ